MACRNWWSPVVVTSECSSVPLPMMLLWLPQCRAGQAELHQQEVGRVHLVLLDGRPRRNGEHSLQVTHAPCKGAPA